MADKEIPHQMKALRLVKYNENYQLRRDVAVPSPGAGELLIRVHAASFCHTDYQVYQGVYQTSLPATPSHEATGVIAACGPQVVGGWNVGDRVGVLNFRNPCGACAGCRWHSATHDTSLDARYCEKKTMAGIVGADGGFAEYMMAVDYALVKLPDSLSFEQAAPLMCAGATIWNAICQADIGRGETMAIVGIGGLGVLGIQMAKALGYRVVAVDKHEAGLALAAAVPASLRPDLIVSIDGADTTARILDFSNGTGLHATVVCTDNVQASDWALHRLQPRGTCVMLGLPEDGFRFDAFNLVFREIVVKGSLHSSVQNVRKMLEVVAEHDIVSHLTIIPIDEAETLPDKVAARAFKGRVVVKI